MPELPGRESFAKQVFGKAEVYDFVLAPLAVLTLALGAYDFAWRHAYVRAAVVTIAAVAVLIAGVAKAAVNYDARRRVRQTHELEGCLETLHAVLLDAFGEGESRPTLRLTIHKPVRDGQEYEQLLEYVGNQRRAERPQAGRRFPAQSGVTGWALRRVRTVVARRVNEDASAFITELIDDWAYTPADAREVNPEVRAWLAIPLFEGEANHRSVHGIVWIDSDVGDFFTEARVALAEAACAGIATFVKRRYGQG